MAFNASSSCLGQSSSASSSEIGRDSTPSLRSWSIKAVALSSSPWWRSTTSMGRSLIAAPRAIGCPGVAAGRQRRWRGAQSGAGNLIRQSRCVQLRSRTRTAHRGRAWSDAGLRDQPAGPDPVRWLRATVPALRVEGPISPAWRSSRVSADGPTPVPAVATPSGGAVDCCWRVGRDAGRQEATFGARHDDTRPPGRHRRWKAGSTG